MAGAPAAPPALVGSAASTGPAASIAQRAPSEAGSNMQLVASWAQQRPTGNGGGSGDQNDQDGSRDGGPIDR